MRTKVKTFALNGTYLSHAPWAYQELFDVIQFVVLVQLSANVHVRG